LAVFVLGLATEALALGAPDRTAAEPSLTQVIPPTAPPDTVEAIAPPGTVAPPPLIDRRPDDVVTSRPYYFYRPRSYGSDAMVHPLRLIANGGFGITQFDNRANELGDIDYATGLENVWDNLADPIAAIEEEGWGDFIEREILPFNVTASKSQHWPNYTLHLIGGGMSYRLMEEWFHYHGYPHTKSFALATLTAYHLLNEVVENDDYVGPSTDLVADFYIFNPLGVIVFSSDRVARFFGETLSMKEWSYQPAINPRTGAIENNGQNFSLKYPLYGKWSLFYHMGTQGELGLSYRRQNGHSISVGIGGQARDLFNVTSSVKSVTIVPTMGIFYDRNHSLLMSFLVADRDDYRVRFNVYPGVLSVGGISSGFFVGVGQRNEVKAGITFGSPWVPLGLAAGDTSSR
jgi:hypothetical protein